MIEQQDTVPAVEDAWPAERRVWFVAAEATPFIKVGGLADVAGELPKALMKLGVKITLCLPLHGGMKKPDMTVSNMPVSDMPVSNMSLSNMSVSNMSVTDMSISDMSISYMSLPVKQLDVAGLNRKCAPGVFSKTPAFPDGCRHAANLCTVQVWNSEGLAVRVYDIPGLFGRENVYAYPDDSERFAAFCLAVAADAETELVPPDILHLNDWHTASLSMLIRHAPESGTGAGLRRIRTLLTVHSLEYQGRGRPSLAEIYGMGPSVMGEDGAACENGFNALKAGIAWSNAITTVSPTYAKEILKPGNGFGLDAFLAKRAKSLKRGRYAGILNRLDDSWNPATDNTLIERYDTRSTEKRKHNKAFLRNELGLTETEEPLLIYIGRLVEGKGIGLLLDAAESWLKDGMQLAVLGKGDVSFQDRIRTMSEKHPGFLAYRFAFDEALARRMVGAADMLLMPSRREACGLSQQIAMRYGCLPVVRKTGGLKDTVSDGENGFVFTAETATALDKAVRRANRLFRDQEGGADGTWRRMMRAAMLTDSSWTSSACEYLRLYLDLLNNK